MSMNIFSSFSDQAMEEQRIAMPDEEQVQQSDWIINN